MPVLMLTPTYWTMFCLPFILRTPYVRQLICLYTQLIIPLDWCLLRAAAQVRQSFVSRIVVQDRSCALASCGFHLTRVLVLATRKGLLRVSLFRSVALAHGLSGYHPAVKSLRTTWVLRFYQVLLTFGVESSVLTVYPVHLPLCLKPIEELNFELPNRVGHTRVFNSCPSIRFPFVDVVVILVSVPVMS